MKVLFRKNSLSPVSSSLRPSSWQFWFFLRFVFGWSWHGEGWRESRRRIVGEVGTICEWGEAQESFRPPAKLVTWSLPSSKSGRCKGTFDPGGDAPKRCDELRWELQGCWLRELVALLTDTGKKRLIFIGIIKKFLQWQCISKIRGVNFR